MDESLNDYVLVLRAPGGEVRFDMIEAPTHEEAGRRYRALHPQAEVMTIGLFEKGDRSAT